jgi:hypothetical protein
MKIIDAGELRLLTREGKNRRPPAMKDISSSSVRCFAFSLCLSSLGHKASQAFLHRPRQKCYCSQKPIWHRRTCRGGTALWRSDTHEDGQDQVTRLNIEKVTADNGTLYDGEVVGGNGRIGSFLLEQHSKMMANNSGIIASNVPLYKVLKDAEYKESDNYVIGQHTLIDSPIYVATPANAIPNVVAKTIPIRRRDLVFVCNGLVADSIRQIPSEVNSSDAHESAPLEEEVTIVVPHFGVLAVGASAIGKTVPSIVYGRHATKVSELLQSASLPVSIVSTLEEVTEAAALKLLWASLMWLLTCDIDDGSNQQCTVVEVHDIATTQHKLRNLVMELLPVVWLLSRSTASEDVLPSEIMTPTAKEVQETMDYLERYSRSMPGARPSFDLGLKEVRDRNGQFLVFEEFVPQSHHKALLRRVLGSEMYQQQLDALLGLTQEV